MPERRRVSESQVTMSQVMLPEDANPYGNVHGGVIMKLVDTAGGVVAMRHVRGRAVTARIDSMDFLQPVYVGNLVTVKASLNDVGRTSMEVGVRVEAENLTTGEVRHVSSAYLIYVALDDHGRAREVPGLATETDVERRRMAEAKIRRDNRRRGEEALTAQRQMINRVHPRNWAKPNSTVIIVGHRGAAGIAPENTLASFQAALDHHVDAIECDVHLSQDGVPVVIHDARLERTTNGTGWVRERTVAELKQLDAGAWFSPTFAGERILTLDEFLSWAKGRSRMVVEIKSGQRPYPEIGRMVLDALRQHAMVDDAMVISFDHQELLAIRTLSDEIFLGALYYARPVDPVGLALGCGADALLPSADTLTPDVVNAAHTHGLALCTWTIDDPDSFQLAAALGVDAITTNVPDRFSR